jgi:HlyD family secretion protein
LAGLVTIVAFFGGFAGWALLADLDSAVIAPGFAVVDSHRKTVQHLEGGILHQLRSARGISFASARRWLFSTRRKPTRSSDS